MQLTGAIRQHRRVGLRQVQLPLVELSDMCQQLGSGFVLVRSGGGQRTTERLIGQVRQREAVHASPSTGAGGRGPTQALYIARIRLPQMPARRADTQRTAFPSPSLRSRAAQARGEFSRAIAREVSSHGSARLKCSQYKSASSRRTYDTTPRLLPADRVPRAARDRCAAMCAQWNTLIRWLVSWPP